MPRPEYKLGKRPPKIDRRTLRLARYLTVALEAPPPSIDHASAVANWPMYGNDRDGSCGPAGAAHQTQSWSTYAESPVTPSETTVIQDYFRITGGQDSGVYLLDMLNYWRQSGIGQDYIEAFVQVNPNITEAELSIQHFGSLGMGLALPDEGTFGPWDRVYGPPNPYNGHYVCAVAYDHAARTFEVVTWGERWVMSYDFFLKYCDEAYAMLNDLSILQRTMVSPEGFDFAQLTEDLDHLSDPIVVPPDVPPEPSPGGCNLFGLTAARVHKALSRAK